MIKTYKYAYNWGDANAEITIDTERLSKENCLALLNFFTWDWDEDKDPYDELGRLYCATAMRFATSNGHNTHGVLADFKEAEGFPDLDGSYGITLVHAEGIDFSEVEIERLEQ